MLFKEQLACEVIIKCDSVPGDHCSPKCAWFARVSLLNLYNGSSEAIEVHAEEYWITLHIFGRIVVSHFRLFRLFCSGAVRLSSGMQFPHFISNSVHLKTGIFHRQGEYVVSTVHDVSKFSEIMPVYAGMINSVYKTCCFIFYRDDVKYLLNKIQENIDISIIISIFSLSQRQFKPFRNIVRSRMRLWHEAIHRSGSIGRQIC